VCGVHVDRVTPHVVVSLTSSEKFVGTRREERKAGILALCDAVEAYIVSQKAVANTVANMAHIAVSGTPIAKPKREQPHVLAGRRIRRTSRRTERQARALRGLHGSREGKLCRSLMM
jgi:hypothetical protein